MAVLVVVVVVNIPALVVHTFRKETAADSRSAVAVAVLVQQEATVQVQLA
jgi:hypothetical protein